MSVGTKLWYLEQFDMVRLLSMDERKRLMKLLIMKTYKAGEYIVFPNEHRNKVYLLKDGVVKIANYTDEGEELVKYILKGGSIFGELAIADEGDKNEIAVALEDCVVCYIDSRTMQDLMAKNRAFNKHIIRIIGLRLKKIERRLEAIIFKDSTTRVKDFLYDFAKEYGRREGDFYIAKNLLTHKDIGKLTYTSRQKVSTILNELRREKLIEYDKNFIRVPMGAQQAI